jgi:hypothetical protein
MIFKTARSRAVSSPFISDAPSRGFGRHCHAALGLRSRWRFCSQGALELAILSEQKTAKVIHLLEESRRDNPLIRNRVDQEAEAMAQPADPQSIKEIHDEAEQISGFADSPQAKGSRQLHTDGPSVGAPITTRDDDSALRVSINTLDDGRGSMILACGDNEPMFA